MAIFGVLIPSSSSRSALQFIWAALRTKRFSDFPLGGWASRVDLHQGRGRELPANLFSCFDGERSWTRSSKRRSSIFLINIGL